MFCLKARCDTSGVARPARHRMTLSHANVVYARVFVPGRIYHAPDFLCRQLNIENAPARKNYPHETIDEGRVVALRLVIAYSGIAGGAFLVSGLHNQKYRTR